MASLTNNTQADGSSGKIRVAIQRVNSAKLLIDNNKIGSLINELNERIQEFDNIDIPISFTFGE
jgi:hypothetical protein